MKALCKKMWALVLVLSLVMGVGVIRTEASVLSTNDILGTWYLSVCFDDVGLETWDCEIMVLNKDGSYVRYSKYENKENQQTEKECCTTYTYDEKTSTLEIKFKDGESSAFVVSKKADGLYYLTFKGTSKPYYMMSKNLSLLGKQFPSYKHSIEYAKTKADKNGFYVTKNGKLVRYIGKKKTVKIPKKVKRIGSGAFEDIPGYHHEIKKVIVPKTCKTLDTEAFTFARIKTIVIKNGVKKIGKRCFADSYLKKLYIPKSVKKIGKRIMDTEEGLTGTKIYVVKNSKADKYFKKYSPYGRYKIKYQK